MDGQLIALRLGEDDAFPAGDLGLARALGGDARDLAMPADAGRPSRPLAAKHLWAADAAIPAGSAE